jgi:hypothetical protein
MYTISKNHKGISAKAIPGKALTRDVYETFSYAVGCYGFLVELNETIDSDEWIKRIQSYYTMSKDSPKAQAIIRAIKIAMPSQHRNTR